MTGAAQMKELEVTIKVRNNRLKRRREELSLSAPAFAAAVGISYGAYIELESLRASPLGADGDWREVVRKIADYHGLSPDELFPPVVRAITQPKVTRELSGPEVGRFISAHQQRAALPPSVLIEDAEQKQGLTRILAALGPQEQKVLRLRFGLDGSEEMRRSEVADRLGVSDGRVHQIESKALQRIRANGMDLEQIERRLGFKARLKAEEMRASMARAQARREREEARLAQEEAERQRLREERARRKEERRRALAARTPEEIEADRAVREAKARAREERRLAAEAAAAQALRQQQEREEQRRIAREKWLAEHRPAGSHAWNWLEFHQVWRCEECRTLARPLVNGFSYSDVGERRQSEPPACNLARWKAHQRNLQGASHE